MSRRITDADPTTNEPEIGSGPSSFRYREPVSHHIHELGRPPKQPLLKELQHGFKETFFADEPLRAYKDQPGAKKFLLILQSIFPILEWGRTYNFSKFKGDLIAGLTIASLCVPQVRRTPQIVKLLWVSTFLFQ